LPDITLGDVTIHFEQEGDRGSPVLLLAGLGGVGRSWGSQIERFAQRHRVVAPDHRGTGLSSRPRDGYTIAQHALDVVALIRALGWGPFHIVGLSTGGAIAQRLALDHPDVVRTVTLASTWARGDSYFRRQFEGRKSVLRSAGLRLSAELNSLFLFSPEFHRSHPDRVAAWVDATASAPFDPEIAIARIDMILAHDELDRLGAIGCPVLIASGRRDFCTPPYFADEIARAVPGAERADFDTGHFIYAEQPEEFHARVDGFIARYE
jgi:aminoacrylate hydrolase